MVLRPRGAGLRRRPRPAEALAGWLALPAATDAFLKDHFGLRHAMIQTHHGPDEADARLAAARIRCSSAATGGCSILATIGAPERRACGARSSGSPKPSTMLEQMRDELQKRGIRFLVASPPNAATVYNDDLPAWAQNQRPAHRIRPPARGTRRARDQDGRSAAAACAVKAVEKAYFLLRFALDRAGRDRGL